MEDSGLVQSVGEINGMRLGPNWERSAEGGRKGKDEAGVRWEAKQGEESVLGPQLRKYFEEVGDQHAPCC